MSIRQGIKRIILNQSFGISFISMISRILMLNHISSKGRGNKIITNIPGLFLSNARIKVRGTNNLVEFKDGGITHFHSLRINIIGDNNEVTIGKCCSGEGLTINIEDNRNRVELGESFSCGKNTELAAIEGTSIIFGSDCMLSANITIRTGDSHSIVDKDGRRTNISKSVIIGNHVWIGNSVLILKSTKLGDNSIVAGGAVVPGKNYPENSILGGNPAKVLKENINWKRERI